MNAYGDQRQRSPAFQGARQAFSSSAAQGSPVNVNRGDYGAFVASSRTSNGEQRTTDEGWDTTKNPHPEVHPQQQQRQNNTTSSYIAANLATRRSVKPALNPTTSFSHGTRPRPAPSRSQSDISARPKIDHPSVDTLITHYEGQDGQVSKDEYVHHAPGKRNASLGTLGGPPIRHSVSPMASSRPVGRPNAMNLSQSPTSAANEPPPRPQRSNENSPHTAHGPPPQHQPRITETNDKGAGNMARNGLERQRSQVLFNNNTPQLSVDSLANAMVASSLASSRAPSPTRPPLPPPRRRSRPHMFHRTHSADEAGSRTPSPSKGTMRTTMRPPLDPNEELSKKQNRNHFLNKHPNKHHEGDRKRWRDQITELERKRYEGVWAANKGLLISTCRNEHPDLANGVLNIIVRDIWSRSRLSLDVLEEIWDLVDMSGTGVLSKEEFVVGMWLVDQRLKGRKLPVKVSDSVWFSARGLTGIKVRKHY